MTRYKAAVIGLGKIGQGFDYDRQDDGLIATHANGYARHPGYELLAAVDPDPRERERFQAKFQRPAYADVASMMKDHAPQVLSIAVPADRHCTVFEEAIRYRPLAVLCEKPIALSLSEAGRMQSLAQDQGCSLAVNYIRRFEPGASALGEMITKGAMGTIFKGVAWYSKGLRNNGSHFIDLLRFWLGEVTCVVVTGEGRLWDGFDPEPDVCLFFGHVPVYLLAGREESFSIGEIDLFGTGGTIRYAESGNLIEVRRTGPDAVFEGYKVLGTTAEIIPTDLRRYQWHVLAALYDHLCGGGGLPSDGKSATETLAVIEAIVRQREVGRCKN